MWHVTRPALQDGRVGNTMGRHGGQLLPPGLLPLHHSSLSPEGFSQQEPSKANASDGGQISSA
jgi:hypothetical protein